MLRVIEDSYFDADPISCECCGHRSQVISGWLEDEQGTLAAYLAHWTEGKPDHGANFDFIVGQWGNAASPANRKAVSVFYRRSDNGFIIIDAESRPFATRQALFSRALKRQDVFGTELAQEIFQFLDAIWLQDSRIGDIRGDNG